MDSCVVEQNNLYQRWYRYFFIIVSRKAYILSFFDNWGLPWEPADEIAAVFFFWTPSQLLVINNLRFFSSSVSFDPDTHYLRGIISVMAVYVAQKKPHGRESQTFSISNGFTLVFKKGKLVI